MKSGAASGDFFTLFRRQGVKKDFLIRRAIQLLEVVQILIGDVNAHKMNVQRKRFVVFQDREGTNSGRQTECIVKAEENIQCFFYVLILSWDQD